ncbi:hypothetical protein H8S95_11775 [Pontibacter sp. KCTC 32443]|uniref:hypothetical protein n=1 Tax=Pontibacter TaxID=323449 RepID=UPI00164E8BDB|nr:MULTISPECIES: hypothetical protein [Pontibacter]MBC5774744.1 hypothetical protein [Pontibacter sp. KCTC 32443]
MENTTDFLEIKVDTEKKLLYGKWLRNVDNREYKAGLRQLYQLIINHSISLWLQNSEHLQPRNAEDQKWAAEEFALLLSQSSMKQLAVVSPKATPHYAILCSMREKAYRIFGKTKQVELFETNEAALKWLTPHLLFYRLPAATIS